MRTSHRALLQKSGNKYIIEMDAEVIEAVGWLEGSEVYVHSDLTDCLWLSRPEQPSALDQVAALADMLHLSPDDLVQLSKI